ncbi:MAG: hypothetical protein KA149_12520 [Chitinophagales bacterium]|nr:hypothetical protein [Chitinophagales bacterium]
MKTLILLMALLPVAAFAGNNDKKSKDVNVTINLSKKGQVEIKGMDGDLKELQDEINQALKNVTIKVDGGKQKHSIQIKAQINSN